METTHIKETLKTLGLNENEIKIYLTSLSHKNILASTLGNQTGISRSTAQYTADLLVKKGLFSLKIHKNSKIYTAEDPNKFILMLNKEQIKLDRKRKNTEQMVENIRKFFIPANFLTNVKYYTGPQEVISLVNEIFTSKTPMYGAFHLGGEAHPEVVNYFRTEYRERRDQKRLKIYALINYLYEDTNFEHIDERDYKIFLHVDKTLFPFGGSVHIYDNKVAFYSYTPNDVSGILIESENIYTTMLSLFKIAWNQARMLPENSAFKDVEI